ncbi:hypothetical protein [Paenibacillus alba]|uniref:Uncharacterized protein n=1 Tax=Paenibacillus alba TaxID=1197127 RepID=A0ABU6GG28_9BACL|nr:hypothetical protein [Paenibacillus alba]MEC0232660.1 hypothetical protein [Paenibacillus alba]
MMDKTISSAKLIKWLEESDLAEGFWRSKEAALKTFDSLTDAISSGDLTASPEELIIKIRLYHQINIFTVNDDWCVQLFNSDEEANGDFDCIYESHSKDFKVLLSDALEWAVDRLRQDN